MHILTCVQKVARDINSVPDTQRGSHLHAQDYTENNKHRMPCPAISEVQNR